MAGIGTGDSNDTTPTGQPFLTEGLRAVLDQEHAVICGLGPDLRIAYINPAYRDFALDNGGGADFDRRFGVGARFLDAVHGQLRDEFTRRLLDALDAGRPWEHDYECSSAHVFRRFHMKCMPLADRAGLLLIHSLIEERPHDQRARAPFAPDEKLYLDDNGQIRQCSYCRRVRRIPAHRPPKQEQWDWIPQWVNQPLRHTTHGVCPACFTYYTGSFAPASR